jgi:ABC-type dipeptide/oligopeptide/nickel transport system permease subunit
LAAISHPLLLGTAWSQAIYDPRGGYDPFLRHPSPPSWDHFLGTDAFGKDTFSMLMAGVAPSLIAGTVAAIVTCVVGLAVAAAGATSRRADRSLGLLVDAALYIPVPVVMLILGADPRADRLTPFVFGLLFGLLTGLSAGALVMRGHALPIMAAGYVDAARISGASTRQVIGRHLLPALVPLAGVYLVLGAAGAVVTQGFLSWLSYTATYSDWGTLVYWAIVTKDLIGQAQWPALIAAGAALSLLTLGFHLVAVGFRRAAHAPLTGSMSSLGAGTVPPPVVLPSAEPVQIRQR